jgi:hypothetical protein
LIGQPRKFRRHCEILLLWLGRGRGDPLITNRTDEPVVRYFRAATKVVFGKAVSASTAKTNIIEFRHLNFSAASLRGEGTLLIDDSKVFVISADGTVKR